MANIYLDGRIVVNSNNPSFLDLQNPKDLAILIYQATQGNEAYATLLASYLMTLVSGASVPSHALNHEAGEDDELDVTGLSGLLADAQTPLWVTGATGDRTDPPTLGEMFFDTTLGLPIWWDGANWIDATGTTV